MSEDGRDGRAANDAVHAVLASAERETAGIDRRIRRLLEERARVSIEAARLARERAGGGRAVEFYRPEREAARLRELARDAAGPLPGTALQRVFREIDASCRALQQPLRVAYLGPEGTYSQAATDRYFGHAIESLPEKGIPDIFRAVESGRAAFGVVPVENSTEGTVNHTLDLLMDTPLRICGEVRLRIEHRLLARPGTALRDVRRVHAHPQALAQCRRWLDAHLGDVERVSESSNARAASIALEQAGSAAIAGEAAAERYGLATLESGIEDVKTNTTRFLVVGDRDLPPSGEDTTSLLLSVPHRPGGLRQMLEPFETAGLSLTRIESRPARSGLWEYVFFVDVSGHRDEPTLAAVLDRLVHELPLLRVLGSYPRAS